MEEFSLLKEGDDLHPRMFDELLVSEKYPAGSRTPEPKLDREVAKPKFATPPTRTELLSPLGTGPRSSTLRSELQTMWPDSLVSDVNEVGV